MKYFSINELCNSNVAKAKKINNTPNEQEINALTVLVDNLLDPLREKFNRPIIINSGFRCKALNDAVKGKQTSQHLKGEAADITSGTREGNKELFRIIKDNFEFDQLIDEKDFSWVHVSLKDKYNRMQVLKL